jgi:hypothetical protein
MRRSDGQTSMTESDSDDSEATGLHVALLEPPLYGGLVLGGEAFTQYAFPTVAYS